MYCICGRSDDDDDDIEFDLLNTPKEKKIKIALLGPSDSGKSTIIKQLSKTTDSYTAPDEKQMLEYMKESLIHNMKTLCQQSIILEETNDEAAIHKSRRWLRDELLLWKDSESLNAEIVLKMCELWKDDGIQFTLQQRHRFQMNNNVRYFFNKIDVITHPEYVPTFEDNVHIHRHSIGHSPARFMKYVYGFGEYSFEMMDVGGCKTERKKWWNKTLLHDPELTAIIYMVPISDYNLTLFEDNKTNRLVDAIDLFKGVMIKGKFFVNKPLFLLFNKYDIYLENIEKIPITHCFDDFPDQMNPNDPDQVLKFIAGKFLDVYTENEVDLKQPLRIMRTTAINETNVEEVFDKIMPKIVGQNLTKFSYIENDHSTSYETQTNDNEQSDEFESQRTDTEDLERYREINRKVISALRSKCRKEHRKETQFLNVSRF